MCDDVCVCVHNGSSNHLEVLLGAYPVHEYAHMIQNRVIKSKLLLLFKMPYHESFTAIWLVVGHIRAMFQLFLLVTVPYDPMSNQHSV